VNNAKNSHSSWTDVVLIMKALGPFNASEPLAHWHSVTFENNEYLKISAPKIEATRFYHSVLFNKTKGDW
jgi:hypothetical protein